LAASASAAVAARSGAAAPATNSMAVATTAAGAPVAEAAAAAAAAAPDVLRSTGSSARDNLQLNMGNGRTSVRLGGGPDNNSCPSERAALVATGRIMKDPSYPTYDNSQQKEIFAEPGATGTPQEPSGQGGPLYTGTEQRPSDMSYDWRTSTHAQSLRRADEESAATLKADLQVKIGMAEGSSNPAAAEATRTRLARDKAARHDFPCESSLAFNNSAASLHDYILFDDSAYCSSDDDSDFDAETPLHDLGNTKPKLTDHTIYLPAADIWQPSPAPDAVDVHGFVLHASIDALKYFFGKIGMVDLTSSCNPVRIFSVVPFTRDDLVQVTTGPLLIYILATYRKRLIKALHYLAPKIIEHRYNTRLLNK